MQSSSTTPPAAEQPATAPAQEEQKRAEYTHTEPMRPAEPSQASASLSRDLAKIRKEYGDLPLDESMIPADGSPFSLFKEWLDFACEMGMIEPNACALATVGSNGRPSNRFVLLKDFDQRGFVWFTNYESTKGHQIAENPYAAMTFWWGPLEKSVRVEGRVEKVSQEESDEYFQKRPRGAELGAWASDQSRPIESQDALRQKYKDCEERFSSEETLQRPDFWGGYRLVPDSIEFWKGRRSRLHDRLRFNLDSSNNNWSVQRLQP